MPKHAEYVFAAYGIFLVVIGAYAAWLILRTQAARRALRQMSPPAKSPRD